jgi:hypothetical protein
LCSQHCRPVFGKSGEGIDLCWLVVLLLLLREWWNGNWYRPGRTNVAALFRCDLWQFCKYDPPTPQEVILSGRHSGHIGYVNVRMSA